MVDRRLGLAPSAVRPQALTYAAKVETWVADPDGARWEWYVKTGDSDQLANEIVGNGGETVYCAPAATEPVTIGAPTSSDGGCC